MFDDDQKIIHFLTLEDTFKDFVIDMIQHDESLTDQASKVKRTHENSTPKSMVRLEKNYDLQDKFKKLTNWKTNSSSMNYEVINLGS